MHKSIWKSRRILITGSRGFIGYNLTPQLQKAAASVMTTPDEDKSFLLNPNKIGPFIRKNNPDMIIHLAATSTVDKGLLRPYDTLMGNFLSTLNILEAARSARTSTVIIPSSVHVNTLQTDNHGTIRPYEASKLNCDVLAKTYASRGVSQIFQPRFANIYGPGDRNFTRIVPRLIRAYLQDDPVVLWNKDTLRDFLYIDDAVSAIDAFALHPTNSPYSSYDFGTGFLTSPTALAHLIAELLQCTREITRVDADRDNEPFTIAVNPESAKKTLNWKPRISLKQGLQPTIKWYKEYL